MNYEKEYSKLKKYVYRNAKYPDDHWAIDVANNDCNIAYFAVSYEKDKELIYGVKVNNTDKSGYRLIIFLIGVIECKIHDIYVYTTPLIDLALNRPFTENEQKGLLEITGLIAQLYKNLGIEIVQFSQLGNNSHSFEDGVTKIGNDKEPSQLHLHIWGRGNPDAEFIHGVSFDCKTPGNDVILREKKKWSTNELKHTVYIFKNVFDDYKRTNNISEKYPGIKRNCICTAQSDVRKRLELQKFVEFKNTNIYQYAKQLSSSKKYQMTFNIFTQSDKKFDSQQFAEFNNLGMYQHVKKLCLNKKYQKIFGIITVGVTLVSGLFYMLKK
jgi:hypothetical protein